jgi:hypothetical protein
LRQITLSYGSRIGGRRPDGYGLSHLADITLGFSLHARLVGTEADVGAFLRWQFGRGEADWKAVRTSPWRAGGEPAHRRGVPRHLPAIRLGNELIYPLLLR